MRLPIPFALLAVTTTIAHATPYAPRPERGIDAFLGIKPASDDGAPTIEVTVIGGTAAPQDRYSLVEPRANPPIVIKATSVRDAATEPIAIALVLEGQEIWIGNDDLVPYGDVSQYPGVLKGLKTALQTFPFAAAGPAGSQGILIVYDETSHVRVPMGPLANLTPEALGTQRDYYGRIGSSMVQSVAAALGELRKVQTPRKALIVISDGNDSNSDTAKAELANLAKLAMQERIDTFAIIAKSALSDARNDITTMIPGAITVASAESLANALRGIQARLAARYYVTFPGHDPALGRGFTWDGAPHDLVVRIGDEEMARVTVALAPVWGEPTAAPTAGTRRWWLLGPIVGLLVLIAWCAKKAGLISGST